MNCTNRRKDVMMVGLKRIVDTSFWTDGKVDDFTPEDKYFMLYLLTNPFTTQLGIYEISIKQVAFQLGYSLETVRALIERFEHTYGIIIYSKSTNEIAIKNFLRHSIIKGGAPVRDCLIKELKQVKNRELIARVFAHIKGRENLNETVKNIIAEYEEKNGVLCYSNANDNEEENDNDNDNDNDVSYHDTSDESLHESSKPAKKAATRKEKPVRHKYGQYGNVLLSDDDLETLKTEFAADWQERIERLSEYMASKGKSYKNHLATIRSWARKDAKEKTAKDGRFYDYDPNEQTGATFNFDFE